MASEFCSARGTLCRLDELRYAKARDLAARLNRGEIQHASLVECRRSDEADTIVFDVRVEVPQVRARDSEGRQIQRRERIAATFVDGDAKTPKVEALRSDFPRVPHLNLHVQEYPRDLCLYEERYDELRRKWTSARFVERIREWLGLTAIGKLHQADQRLEPLLVDYAGHVMLPADLAEHTPERLYVTTAYGTPQQRAFYLTERSRHEGEKVLPLVVSVHRAEPQTHGVIHASPQSLADVAAIAQAAGLDLLASLRAALPKWKEGDLASGVMLVLLFPKRRTDTAQPEEIDTWCFALGVSVRDLGTALGVWQPMGTALAALLEWDPEKRGQDVKVEVLNPCFGLTRITAAQANGRASASELRFVGVGVGALGSQLVLNCARAGFGRWTLIDHDRLMPHNLARHALTGSLVGCNKAEAVAFTAGTIASDADAFTGLDSDVQVNGEAIKTAFHGADVIVDMSASVAAQRFLARDTQSQARRLCTFLNPTGTDLVLLAEDSERKVRLDALEMQFYRSLLRDEALSGHVQSNAQRHRYARSCGDTSSAIPQDLVALHAAIASRNVKAALESQVASIDVWRADAHSAVRQVSVKVHPVEELDYGEWTVVLDEGLRERLRDLRSAKLPNETGGVLLGSFDLQRRILYVVDTLPSPPDSDERSDLYIRGFKGLQAAVEEVDATTGGMLEYIGEWHSHPRGSSTRPSGFDLTAFGWLTALMSGDGLPAVMMIVGDDDMRLFVGSMLDEASLSPEDENAQVA